MFWKKKKLNNNKFKFEINILSFLKNVKNKIIILINIKILKI